MNDTQKWPDLEESIEKSTMTEEEKRKQKERKAHELQIMVKRAELVLEGNRRLVQKRRAEVEIRKSKNENWASYLRDRKNRLDGFKVATPSTEDDPCSKETDPATYERLGHPQPGGETRRGNDVVSSPLQDVSDAAEARPKSE